MTKLKEFRQQYPQYDDMTDADLSDRLYKKFYSDLPREEYDAKIGYSWRDEEAKANYQAAHGDIRPATTGDEVSRDTILPFREVLGPDGKPKTELAVPGIVMEPWRAAERLFTKGTASGYVPLSQSRPEVAEALVGDAMAASSLAMPGTRVPNVTVAPRLALERAAATDEAFGPIMRGVESNPRPSPPLQTLPREVDAVAARTADDALGPQIAPERAQPAPVLGGKPRDELMAAADRLGVDLPVALASDSHLVRGAAGPISGNPLGGTPIVTAMRKALDTIEQRRQEQIDSLGGSSKVGAGQTARDQIAEWITNQSKAEADEIYAVLDSITERSGRVPLKSLRDTLSAIEGRASGMRLDPPGIIKAFRAAADDADGLTYDQLKDLRTQVGQMQQGMKIGPQAGIDDAALKQIYGALTEDMERSVREAGRTTARENIGDPDVRRAIREQEGISRITPAVEARRIEQMGERADRYRQVADEDFRTKIADKREALRKIIGNDANHSPEDIVKRITSYASSKGASDIGRLQSALSVLDESARNELRAATLSEMGMKKDGFSLAEFRTKLAGFSSIGKQVFFGPELSQVLDDISTVGQRYEQLAKLGNPSGTGRALAFTGMGSTAGYSIMAGTTAPLFAAVGAIVGTYAVARLLARPATARLIRDFGEAQLSGDAGRIQAATAALAEAGRALEQQELGEEKRL